MHTNSINAWRECQELFSNRELMILNFLEVHKTEEFTDREIMCRLGFSDPNAVRPRTMANEVRNTFPIHGNTGKQKGKKLLTKSEWKSEPKRNWLFVKK